MSGVSSQVTICPKCDKPAWAPYGMKVTGKYGQVYSYLVYRHRARAITVLFGSREQCGVGVESLLQV
ncbi:MAG: hypothetical protein ABR867_04725 [Nitrososphaerales archaeon]